MTIGNLRNLELRFLEDQKITQEEAKALIDSAGDFLGVSSAERNELREILVRNQHRLEPAAQNTLERFLGLEGLPRSPVPEVVRSVVGPNPADFADDTIYLGGDGTLKGESGVVPYTRGYDSTRSGPLRFKHGSPAPASSLLSAEEGRKLREQTPGAGLDQAAAAFGVRVEGFEKMAHSKSFYDDEAEFWWGKCHAWAWSALSSRIDKLVEVDGPAGERGVWIAGAWMSRADLGNWMMAVADEISVNSPNQLFKADLSAEELVKGTAQFMMNNGGGVIADIHNDKKHGGERQVWNQPFVSSELTTRGLDPQPAKALLERARAEGVRGGSGAKQLTIVGRYGAEVDDHHEGPSNLSSKTWNLYAVVDPSGKMLKAYMADDERLKAITGLPTTRTDELPEYFWKPRLAAIDDVLAGKTNWTVETNAHRAEFKFLLNTVLSKGVPAVTRTAFEAAVAALPAGKVDAGRALELARSFPGVANAYLPEQWARAFSARGLEARAFGAGWRPGS